ncbi:complement component C9 [Bombina bombina]|uniref:complement component C9 n=1 Tax=Bombina bombina TaxID=8345 RepID=UPI00235AD5F4|nr:complement component C9 [Bombina bombina]
MAQPEQITTTDISNCLGFNLDLSVKAEGVDGKAKIENEKCKKVLGNTEQTGNKSGVIDNVVSFVDGGTTQFASTLGQKLERGERAIDLEIYVQWAISLAEAPVLIKQKPNAIYSLIPVDVKDAHTKKMNLERAIEDYLNEFSVCKCQPCQNGGTTLLLDGECICKCTLHFEGTACQNRKSDIEKPPSIAIDGQWGCWSVSSACINEEQTLTRQCNNPAPAFGGKQCPGDSQKQIPC